MPGDSPPAPSQAATEGVPRLARPPPRRSRAATREALSLLLALFLELLLQGEPRCLVLRVRELRQESVDFRLLLLQLPVELRLFAFATPRLCLLLRHPLLALRGALVDEIGSHA